MEVLNSFSSSSEINIGFDMDFLQCVKSGQTSHRGIEEIEKSKISWARFRALPIWSAFNESSTTYFKLRKGYHHKLHHLVTLVARNLFHHGKNFCHTLARDSYQRQTIKMFLFSGENDSAHPETETVTRDPHSGCPAERARVSQSNIAIQVLSSSSPRASCVDRV